MVGESSRQIRKWQYMSFAIIVLLNFLVHYHSLFHTPRSEQLWYLAETIGIEDLPSLLIKGYSLSRTRIYNPGDELSFRPAFFSLLGTEKWLFGNNFMCWQMAGLILHFIVLWWLLRLLLEIRISIFAPLLVTLFSVLTVSMEAVTWTHINSYVLFTALIVISVHQAYLHVREGMFRRRRLWIIGGCLLIASFTYEIGVLFSLLFTSYLWISYKKESAGGNRNPEIVPLKRRSALILLVPVVLYLILSYADFRLRGINIPEGPRIFGKAFSVLTIKNIVHTIGLWSYAGIFPELAGFQNKQRMMLELPYWKLQMGNLLSISVAIGLLLIFVYILILRRSISRKHQQGWGVIAFLGAMLLSYCLVFAVVRVNARGAIYLTGSLYSSYFFWSILIILIYCLVDFEKLKNFKFLKCSAIILITALIFLNGTLSRSINLKLVNYCGKVRVLVTGVETILSKYGNEPDFSFSIDIPPNDMGNVALYDLKKADGTMRVMTIMEVLYPQYVRNPGAKYRLLSDGSFVKVVP